MVHDQSDSTFSNFFSLEAARPIEAKFHVEPQWDSGTKVCSNGPGHITRSVSLHKNVLKFEYFGQMLRKILFSCTYNDAKRHVTCERFENADSGAKTALECLYVKPQICVLTSRELNFETHCFACVGV